MSKDRFYKELADHVQRLLDEGDLALGDKTLSEICYQFGGKVFRRSSIMDGFCHFLNVIKPSGETCFEIGTFNGITAIALSKYFENVVSIDIFQNITKYQIMKYMNIKNVHFVSAQDNEEKRHIAGTLKFDYAYMDGNHLKDTELDWELTKRCGNVMFHEYWEKQPSVWNLVNSLPKEQVTIVNNFAYWHES